MNTINVDINLKKYHQKTILENICVKYPVNGIHAVLGANGSGKTTLFKCMANYTDFEGQRTFPETVSVGFLPADLYMYPYITGEEFIRFYIKARGLKYDKEEKKKYNKMFQLPLKEYAVNYSTGMMKKLYLMALLLQHNDILLLDEPFNGLDYVSVMFITSVLQNLKEKGYTIFIASHIVEHLLSFCDTLSVIENGTINYYDKNTDIENIYHKIKQEGKEILDTADF